MVFSSVKRQHRKNDLAGICISCVICTREYNHGSYTPSEASLTALCSCIIFTSGGNAKRSLLPRRIFALHCLPYFGKSLQRARQTEKSRRHVPAGIRRKKKAWGPDHTSTLDTVNNLGLLYSDQGKLAEAEALYL